MSNKKLYIIMTQTGTAISRMIKLFTKAPYNHSSISSDEKLNEMYSFSRYYKHTPLPAGFSEEHVNTCVFGMYSNVPCAIYSLDVNEEQFKNYRHLLAYFKKEKNYFSFNIMGFIGGILNISIPRKRKFVCSQFVAYMLRECGIYTFDKDLFLITPDDFRYMPGIKLIFQGNLKDYYNDINGYSVPKIPVLRRTS